MTDPGGIFPSNVHRRVLGHLSLPTDPYGWTADQLVLRMRQDHSTWFESHDQILPYLHELEKAGDATLTDVGWRMTQTGFERLTGPAVESFPEGPAMIMPAPALREMKHRMIFGPRRKKR